jgi:hypothetical protein
MKLKTFFGSFVLFVCATTSMAQTYKWTPIATASGNQQQPVIGVDYSRTFVANQVPIVFWNDFTFGNLVSTKRPNNRPMHIYRTKIDCKNRMISNDYSLPVEVKHFHDQNPEQYQSPWQGKGDWYVPDIGSAHEFVMNHFCGFKNP